MRSERYSTKEIADAIGVHVNTIRFYEQIGFLTAPERRANGYRSYTALHMEQGRLIRLAMRAEVLQNGLRKQAVEIVQRCGALDFEAALSAALRYRQMICTEMQSARAAIASVERQLQKAGMPGGCSTMTRKEAAKALGVTGETLRTWERSGLIAVGRGENGYRAYTEADMERLNVIRTLRCANYSLSAILRLLNEFDRRQTVPSVEKTLNTPAAHEPIVSACDRLLLSLQNTAEDAKELAKRLAAMQNEFPTLQ